MCMAWYKPKLRDPAGAYYTEPSKDGRVLSGMVREKTDRTIVLQSMTERVTMERNDIESLTESPSSIMPEGFLDALTESQVRDLIGYLMTKQQVPLPQAAK